MDIQRKHRSHVGKSLMMSVMSFAVITVFPLPVGAWNTHVFCVPGFCSNSSTLPASLLTALFWYAFRLMFMDVLVCLGSVEESVPGARLSSCQSCAHPAPKDQV